MDFNAQKYAALPNGAAAGKKKFCSGGSTAVKYIHLFRLTYSHFESFSSYFDKKSVEDVQNCLWS